MNLSITPAAETFLLRMLRFGGAPGCGLRLLVGPGGCSGLAVELAVEANPREGDTIYEHHAIKLFIPEGSWRLLPGVTIDFADTPTETGLVIRDPKSASCDCQSGTRNQLSVESTVDASSIGRRR